MDRHQQIILASKSPRRKELLTLWGIPFESIPASVEEPNPNKGEPLDDYVKRVARIKAEFISEQFPDRLVLAADTIVAIGDEILGKPVHEAQARAFLRKLSGKEHDVWTGTALICRKRCFSFVRADVTRVLFRQLCHGDIDRYVDTGEPLDKAGAYAIQGEASKFVQEIHGEMDTVIGLPKKVVLSGLTEFERLI